MVVAFGDNEEDVNGSRSNVVGVVVLTLVVDKCGDVVVGKDGGGGGVVVTVRGS